jgi:hypothetical protein
VYESIGKLSEWPTESVNNTRQESLTPIKPDHASVCPSRSDQFSTLSRLQNPVAMKPWIGIGRMSNQWKAEFVNGRFHILVSREVMAKFCQNPDLWRKLCLPRISIQQTGRLPDSCNS